MRLRLLEVRWVFLVFLVFLVATSSSSVRAAKPTGIALSDRFRFFPALELEFRYDTNVFAQPSSVGAPLLRVIPKAEVATTDPNSVALSFGIGGDIRKYFSSNQQLGELASIYLNSDLEVLFNPNGAFAVGIVNNFRRTADPATDARSDPLNRIFNQVGPRFVIQPGGRALTFDIGYLFMINRIESREGSQVYPNPDFNQHEFRMQGKWRFFEKTAVTIDFLMDILEFVNGSTLIGGTPVKTNAGLVGQLLPKLALTAKAGYGNSLSSSGPSFSSAVGLLELNWTPLPTLSLAPSYQRDYIPSNGWANYYDTHHVALRFSMLLAQRLTISLDAHYQRLTFSNNPSSNGSVTVSGGQRLDDLVQLNSSVGISITNWFRLLAGVQFELRTSNATITVSGIGNPTATIDYRKVQVYLNAGAAF